VELNRIGKGITQDEFERSQIMMKSRVIMQGRIFRRAGGIAGLRFLSPAAGRARWMSCGR